MTVLQDILVWILIGFPVIFLADTLTVMFEYWRLKPSSNVTMVAQLEKLAKEMARSKKRGSKKKARQVREVASEIKLQLEGNKDVNS